MVMQNILGGLGRNLRDTVRLPAVGARPALREFRVTMEIGGTGVTFRDGVSLVHGDYNLVAHYRVQAQEEATFGWGSQGDQVNQGFVYLQLKDDATTPGDIDGPVRFVMEDAHGTGIPGGLVLQETSIKLDASQTDRTLMLPLPKHDQWATEDSRLAIRIDPTTTATVEADNSTVNVPITLRRVGR